MILQPVRQHVCSVSLYEYEHSLCTDTENLIITDFTDNEIRGGK